MVRSLIKIGLTLIVCIVIYNFFFGTNEERAQSRKIFGEMRDVVVSIGQLVRSERQKFDAGKYDAALEKLGGAYRTIREKARGVDENVLQRLEDLEKRKASLETELQALEAPDNAQTQVLSSKKKKSSADEAQLKAAKAADLQRRQEDLQRRLDLLLRDSEMLFLEAQDK